MEPPIEGMKRRPDGEDYEAPAFVGLVRFSLGHEETLNAYKAETGRDPRDVVRRSPIAQMVDKATGWDRDQFAAFADWIVVNEWGEEVRDGE